MHSRAGESFSEWRLAWSLPVASFIAGSGFLTLAAPLFLSPERATLLLPIVGGALIALAFPSLVWQSRIFLSLRSSRKRNRAIASLYSELRPLTAREDHSPELEERIRLLRARLQELQEEEAEEMRRRFEMVWKPGEGHEALEEVKRILARYEDPSATDPASLHHG